MKPDATTIAVYDAKTLDYKKLGPSTDERKVEVRFAQSLPQGGTVLDYGCGPGRTAGYFARQGLITHAFDASKEMVKLTREHSGVTVWQAGFDTFSAPDTYHGIWASFSLLHAARSDMPALLGKIHEALKAGGKFYIALKLGQGEARDGLAASIPITKKKSFACCSPRRGLNGKVIAPAKMWGWTVPFPN